MREKNDKSRAKRSTKRLVLLSLSVLFIVFGLWFSSSNAYQFLKGYLIFKTGQADAKNYDEKPVIKSENNKEQSHVKKEEKEDEGPLYQKRPEKGDHIGDLIIPKLEARLPIYHGTDEEELVKGVGHFAGSVLPGEKDNSVLSGHRDTIFRKLGEVGKGDLLVVKTSAGEFTYKVKRVRIVDEDDRTVIVPKPRATLTVSTCYPFEYIGSAPERYILVADLISAEKIKK